MDNLSHENEFYLRVSENSFSYERVCTRPHVRKQDGGNSEMDYFPSLF